MSIDLNSLLNAGNGASLNDLVSLPNIAETPINNRATANNMATHASLLGNSAVVVDNYKTMMGEFDTNEGSQTHDALVKDASDKDNSLTFDEMANIMGDDTVPLNERTNLLNIWSVNSPVQPKDPHQLVQTQQLANDGAIVDDDEVETTRMSIAQGLAEVNAYNAEIQKMVNEAQVKSNPSNAETIKNFIESVIPFTESPNVADVLKGQRSGTTFDNLDANVKSLFTLGESKEEIRAKLASIPLDKRLEAAQAVYDLVINSNKSIVGGKNELMMMSNLRQYLIDGEYGSGDRILDDLTSLLDAVGVGASVRAVVRGIKGPADAARVTGRMPRSLADTVGGVNTRSANEIYNTAAGDETGAMADTLYNSTREDAVVNTVGPEIGMEDGVVRHKPLIDDDQFDPDLEAVNKVTDPNGNIQYTPAEKKSKLQQINSDFRADDKTGLTHHKEMTTIRQTDRGVEVRTVYGPAEGGFASGEEALDQVKVATRKYGVKDEELQLLRREPNGNYKPVDVSEFTDIRQSIPANHTRYYHGGAPARGAGSLPYVVDRSLAEADALGVEGGKVYYVDVPNDSDVIKDGVKDIVELPDGLSYQRKLVPEGGLPEGNYLVGVNHTSEYDPADTIAWSTTSVKGTFLGIPLNIFDRLPVFTRGKSGSVTQHLIPPSAYIDPTLTRSASVSADRAAYARHVLFQTANRWADRYTKLKPHQKKALDNYIVEANHKSLKFDPNELRARGWDEDQMSAIRAWKETQDTLFVLENVDLARQTRRAGYTMLEAGDTKQVVKEINQGTATKLNVTQAYDPMQGSMVAVGSKKAIYDEGGTIAIFRTPLDLGNDVHAKYVIVRQKPGSYTRAIRDSDQLLNYRDGHFTIYYRHPVFITTEAKTVDGEVFTQVIATAPNIPEGKKFVARLQRSNPKKKYSMRGDLKDEEFDEMDWNGKVHTGRTSQRTRGEMLQDTTDRPIDPEFRHILTPEESVVRSINSISRRIDMKEWVDVAKKRFMDQYKQYLPRNPDTMAPMWPRNVKDLQKPDLLGDKADFNQAVSTFRYIDQQENGFINLLDDASKNFFKAMAETAGQKGWGMFETAARMAAEVSPATYARKKAFRLTLAANPQRQILIQVSQALPVILGTNPTYLPRLPWEMFLTWYIDRGGDVSSWIKMVGKGSGITEEQAHKLVAAYNKSGISSAVSAHSQIRDDIARLVNRGVLQKSRALVAKPLDIMQKIGFEAGENMLMRSVWLSEYNKLSKVNKAPTAEDLAMLHARVRDLTWNMNKAGELAYNENMFSTVMQFAQAQHKAMAQIFLGHRGLTVSDRIRLGTLYVLTYGTGYGLAYDQISKLLDPKDRELHDTVSGGFFNLALNKVLSAVYGDKVNVDFSSSMRPFEVPNIFKMFTSLGELNLQDTIMKSPSLSLVVGDNARIGNLVKALNRWWTVPEDDGNLKDVAMTFANMFSGASNTFKALYTLKRGYATSTKGDTSDPNVNEIEALMKFFGFSTVDEMLGYAVNQDVYRASSAFKDDVKYLIDETSRRLAREGISDQEVDYIVRIYSEANRVFGHDPEALRIVQSELERRAGGGDYLIFNSLMRIIPITSEADFFSALNKAPLDEEKKNTLIKAYNMMKEQ